MKKLLALVLAVVMMLGIASVAFAETAATDTAAVDSLQTVLDAGVLKVGVDATFAPLTFKDADGNIVGYDIDLANAVAEKLGVTVEFVEIADWTAIATLLADGTVDCVWSGLTITDERAAVMTLSDAYLADTTSLMVAEGVTTLEELAGKTVAVQAGSSTEELICGSEFADFSATVTIVGTPTYEDAFTALTTTEVAEAASSNDAAVPVDAVVISGLVANYNITNNEALAGYTVIENLASDYIGIGFAKGNYKLCGAVEEALYALAQDGTIAAISTKWFGSDISLIAPAAASETSSLDAVTTAGVLKVGVDASFAPMTFKDADGNYTGYDVELVNAVAAKLGVAVEFVEVDWANLEVALADGTIDCVWSGMSINDERKASMTISDAYLESNTTILVNDEVAGFIEDLEGKTIAVQAGSFAEEILKGLVPAESIVTFATSDEAIAAMLKQAEIDAAAEAAKDAGTKVDANAEEGLVLADAVMLDSVYAAYQIASNEELAGFIMIEDLYADLFGIGFAKGDCLLCGAVEEALYELAEEGTVASITATWFGEDVSLIGK